MPQESLQAIENPESVVNGDAWIPLEDAMLPYPEVGLNPAATERFVHGQEVVVFKPGIDDVSTDANVVVRGADHRLLGIGTVRSVLARGRTLSIAPSMVLEAAPPPAGSQKVAAEKLP